MKEKGLKLYHIHKSSLVETDHILEWLGKQTDVEVVLRPIRRASWAGSKIDHIIRKIERQM